ncbi:MAG: UDP-N-acetylmuramoyl-tripeptide--D-alanyl-D-alanine ligase [Candidatus Roizmanbacteria bacterium]
MIYERSFLTGISILLYLWKVAEFIYLYQIKEYRFDRIKSTINEHSFLKILYSFSLKMPAKKPRNAILLLLAIVASVDIYLIATFLPQMLSFIFLAFIPIYAFAVVSLCVYVTNILAHQKRQSIIAQAITKVHETKTIFIGITGSYGKSSTKEFLYQILSRQFITGKTQANMNTDVGIALNVLQHLHEDTEYFIAEMGAYKIGEITNCCKITPPTYAIITSIGNQHLDLFGSRENLINAKKELLLAVPSNGTIILNRDIHDYEMLIKDTKAHIITFSTTQEADVYATNILIKDTILSATIHTKNQQFEIRTHLIGVHNIANILPCITLALELGIKTETIVKAIAYLDQIKGKLSQSTGINNTTILDDSYNSNESGFISAIQTMEQFPHKKKYIISKGIPELGKEKNDTYNRIISRIKSTSIALLTTDTDFSSETNTQIFASEQLLFDFVNKNSDSDTLILIEGRIHPSLKKRILK